MRRRLSLVWGVTAVAVPWLERLGQLLERFREPVRATGIVPPGATVVVTGGWPREVAGVTNLLHVTTI